MRNNTPGNQAAINDLNKAFDTVWTIIIDESFTQAKFAMTIFLTKHDEDDVDNKHTDELHDGHTWKKTTKQIDE